MTGYEAKQEPIDWENDSPMNSPRPAGPKIVANVTVGENELSISLGNGRQTIKWLASAIQVTFTSLFFVFKDLTLARHCTL